MAVFPRLGSTPPFLSAESEIAAEETTWKENTWRGQEESASLDNQRLWRGAILLLLLRGVVKDACYERRADKMTDRNKFHPSARL